MAQVLLRIPRIRPRSQICAQKATCVSAHRSNFTVRDISSTGDVRLQKWQSSSHRRTFLHQENCCRRFIASCYKTVASVTRTSCKNITTLPPQQEMQHVHGARLLKSRTASDPAVLRAYEDLLRIITDIDPHEPVLRDILNPLHHATTYNLQGGKRNRLLALVNTYEILAKGSAHHLDLACLLGWCVELLQVYFLVLDDIMDESPTRRGQPSWHAVPGVGLRAINDALFFDKALLLVIRRCFSHLPCYLDLLELFQDMDLRTVLGQGLDMVSEKGPLLETFTPDRYWTIIAYKTAFYTFVLPVRAGMLLAGVSDPALHEQAQRAAIKLGQAYQMQDDYLDSFGDPKLTGKVGTDITERKCTWLAVTALQLASPEQACTLKAHYGKGVPGGPDELAVKAVYEELDLRKHYADFERKTFQEFDQQLLELSPDLADIFRFLKNKIFGREK